MTKERPSKPLYIVAIFTSIAAGSLAFSVEIVTQFYYLKIVPHPLIFADLVFAVLTACIIFLICLINIAVLNYIGTKPFENIRRTRLAFLSSLLLSSIPLFAGFLFIRFSGNLLAQKINIHSLVSSVIPHPSTHWSFIALFICILFFSSTLIYVLLNSVVTLVAKQKLELENAELKVKNIEATYQQLKQQVNPHFLFNSLSTLKTLINDNPEGALFLKHLSDFLRASVSFNNKNTITLQDELKFCLDYLELLKVRFGDALQFFINTPENENSGLVPVFAIQQLIENAIKHNVLTVNYPLHINIDYENHRIVVSNNMKLKNTSEESTGVGLANLAERYKILSGDEIIIQTNNNCFSVSIKILQNENSYHRGRTTHSK